MAWDDASRQIIETWQAIAITQDLPQLRTISEERLKRIDDAKKRWGSTGAAALAKDAADWIIEHPKILGRQSPTRITFDWWIERLDVIAAGGIAEPPAPGKILKKRRRAGEKTQEPFVWHKGQAY